MIKIHCPEQLATAVEFAVNNGCAAKLLERLAYLCNYGNGEVEHTCHLHWDHAPLSFEFVIDNPDGSHWFNGGLIYSGPGQPLDGSGPAFTVGIGNNNAEHSWSTHT